MAKCFGGSIGVNIPVVGGLTVGGKIGGQVCRTSGSLEKSKTFLV